MNEMIKEGIELNVRIYVILIDGMFRVGCLDEVFKLCDEMVGRGLVFNIVVCNIIMYWFFKEGDI